MARIRKIVITSVFVGLLAMLIAPALSEARPRSGSSFGGRSFRTPSTQTSPRSYGSRGPNVVIFPGFGWGFMPFGFGGGGSLLMLAALGLGAFYVVRAVKRAHANGSFGNGGHEDDEHDGYASAASQKVYVNKLQLALGRSARGLQNRLTKFAEEGDTGTEQGLAQLLSQTAVELMREKDSIRYGEFSASGPHNLTQGETKLNGLALAERSRFNVERVRNAGGQVRRAAETAAESPEVLEYIVVTVIAATRQPLGKWKEVNDRETLEEVLGTLGGVPASNIMGLEVIWTPADPEDSLTETDLLTTYPQMRGV